MNARALILLADSIAREKGLTQSEWSMRAGFAKNGQTVSRIISKGNCRLSTFLRLLSVLDYRLEIVEKDDLEDCCNLSFIRQEDL